MLRRTRIASFVFLAGLFSIPGWAATPRKSEKADPARQVVDKILRDEIAFSLDRREKLSESLKAHPESSSVRWQSGYIHDGDNWVSYDVAASTTDSDAWREYQSRRENAATTFDGQLALADWCRTKHLFDQELAHLTAALPMAPQVQQPALFQRLGYVQVGTHWLSHEQVLEWQRFNRFAEASLRRWSSKLEHIARRLAGTKRQHETAVTELHSLANRSAVPAIEFVLTGEVEKCAAGAVETLKKIDGHEATQALARQAVFSKWPKVRAAASAALKSRKLEEFVPAIISLLVVPSQSQLRTVYDSSGLLLLQSYVVAVETEDQFQVKVFNIVAKQVDQVVAHEKRGTPGVPTERYVVGPSYQSPQELENAADKLYVQKVEQETADERIRDLNDRLIGVLATVSGRESSTDPHEWWQWWSDYTDTQAASAKTVTVVEEQESTVSTYTPVFKRTSCFAAGTPVWTETGLKPIEKLKIGDRVLAKDVETGELTYKPVLKTTVRPPRELTTLKFDEETIVCTGGHRFWSSGEGWVKARDLSPHTMLHTVTGNTPVWSAKKGETAETYNLVVADFHTYFVGKTGVLCQDVLIPQATDSFVPGLQRK